MPTGGDLSKQLAHGAFSAFTIRDHIQLSVEGLQVTAAEAIAPKAPNTKKKGKRGGAPRQRQARITNTHLKGIDLSKDYVAPGK